jgi:hypothetical protein
MLIKTATHHEKTTLVSLEEYKYHERESVVRSPTETQNCDLSQTHIDHEVESVQQTQHHQAQGAYHLFHD